LLRAGNTSCQQQRQPPTRHRFTQSAVTARGVDPVGTHFISRQRVHAESASATRTMRRAARDARFALTDIEGGDEPTRSRWRLPHTDLRMLHTVWPELHCIQEVGGRPPPPLRPCISSRSRSKYATEDVSARHQPTEASGLRSRCKLRRPTAACLSHRARQRESQRGSQSMVRRRKPMKMTQLDGDAHVHAGRRRWRNADPFSIFNARTTERAR